jgi:predicted nucleotidyltransferase
MKRENALIILAEHKDELRALGVAAAYLYGPIARGAALSDMEIDVLVELARPMGFFQFLEIERQMTEWLGQTVHLMTPDAFKAAERERILSEAVRAA